jgi:hypothetical protein
MSNLSNFSHPLTFGKRIRTFILEVCSLRGLVSQTKSILSLFYRKEKKDEKNGSQKPEHPRRGEDI